MVLSNGTSMKGARMDGTSASVSGEELWESGVKVVGDEWGNDVLITVWNDKKVAHTHSIEIVLPSQAREYTQLRASGTRSTSLCISVHCFGC